MTVTWSSGSVRLSVKLQKRKPSGQDTHSESQNVPHR